MQVAKSCDIYHTFQVHHWIVGQAFRVSEVLIQKQGHLFRVIFTLFLILSPERLGSTIVFDCLAISPYRWWSYLLFFANCFHSYPVHRFPEIDTGKVPFGTLTLALRNELWPFRIIRDNTASKISKILPANWLKSRIWAFDWVLLNWSECQKIRFERGCTLNHSFFDHVILSSGISFQFSFKSLSECSRMIEHKL